MRQQSLLCSCMLLFQNDYLHNSCWKNSLQSVPIKQSGHFFFNSNKVNTDLYCCYLLDLVTSLFPLDVDEPDSLSCLKAFFRKNAIASWAPRLDRPRDRQTMLPTSRSPLAIICREDFLPGSLHDDVLAVWVEGTSVPAVVWEAAKLASMAVSKSWGNW